MVPCKRDPGELVVATKVITMGEDNSLRKDKAVISTQFISHKHIKTINMSINIKMSPTVEYVDHYCLTLPC
jgi:hypothetical protein